MQILQMATAQVSCCDEVHGRRGRYMSGAAAASGVIVMLHTTQSITNSIVQRESVIAYHCRLRPNGMAQPRNKQGGAGWKLRDQGDRFVDGEPFSMCLVAAGQLEPRASPTVRRG